MLNVELLNHRARAKQCNFFSQCFVLPKVLLNVLYHYAPNFEKMKGHIALVLSVRASVRSSFHPR